MKKNEFQSNVIKSTYQSMKKHTHAQAGTSIDVGEIVAQYLYLNMPPYPTLPGKSLDDIPDEVVFEWGSGDGEEGGEGGQGGGGKAKKKKKERPGW